MFDLGSNVEMKISLFIYDAFFYTRKVKLTFVYVLIIKLKFYNNKSFKMRLVSAATLGICIYNNKKSILAYSKICEYTKGLVLSFVHYKKYSSINITFNELDHLDLMQHSSLEIAVA